MLTYRFVTDDPDAVAEGPCDDDWIIQGQPSGPDVLSRHEHTGFVGTFTGDNPIDEMMSFIKATNDRESFWPNVWYINERGAVDLCVIVTEDQDGEAPGDFPDADASTMPATDGCADLGGAHR